MNLESDVARIFRPAEGGGTCADKTPESSFSLRSIGENEKREAALTVVPVGELLAEPDEPERWLIDGLLPRGGLSILAGKPKAGKSTLARCMALAVARGDPVIGRESVAGPVIYLCLEDKRAEVAEHFRAMGAGDERLYVHTGPAPAPSDTAVEQLRQLIGQTGATLAVIDTLLRFVRVRDVADYAEMTKALDPMLDLSRETACHVMAVYHAPKVRHEGLDAILGSVAIAGTCDTGLVLDRKADGRRTLVAVQRYGPDLPETILGLEESTRTVTTPGTVAGREQAGLADAILAFLADGPRSEAEIRTAVGGDRGKVGKGLRELVNASRVARSGRGVSGDPYLYKVVE